jgi:predicted DNA-binding transcriptional regulator AlpA
MPSAAKKFAPNLLSRKQLLERIPLSYPTVWKLMQRGEFPRSRSVGGKIMWLEREVAEWAEALPVVQLKGDRQTA